MIKQIQPRRSTGNNPSEVLKDEVDDNLQSKLDAVTTWSAEDWKEVFSYMDAETLVTCAQLAVSAEPVAPTESQIIEAAEKAGLWPNTVHNWMPQFLRHHQIIAAPVAAQEQPDAVRNKYDWVQGPYVTDTMGSGWCVRIDGTDIFADLNQHGCKGRVTFQIARGLPSKEEAEKALNEWLGKYITAQQPVSGADGLPIELRGIAEAIGNGGGFWRSCSGCHELNEGHDTGPFSKVLGCTLGGGCSECGGIGAVWDTTDYGAMGDALAAISQPTVSDPASGDREEFDSWWSRFTAEHDEWRYADSHALRWAAWQARAALTQQDADKEDAERYRWLRNEAVRQAFGDDTKAPAVFNVDDCYQHDDSDLLEGEELDASIDTARQEKKQ